MRDANGQPIAQAGGSPRGAVPCARPGAPLGAFLLAVLLAAPVRAGAPEPSAADDDRVWEDISYGTGEAEFTAIAVDPDNPRRLWAGANGSVYASTDGGVSWTRLFTVKGSAGADVGDDARRAEDRAEQAFEDQLAEARDELVEEYKQEITEELVSELGEYGEILAAELAEELAEQRLREEEDRIADDVRQELRKRGEDLPVGDAAAAGLAARRTDPRRIHRILALAGGRVLVAGGSGLWLSADGVAFEQLAPGLSAEDHDVRAASWEAARPAALCAGSATGVWCSADGGDSWVPARGLPQSTPVVDLVSDPAQPARMLAATLSGVYRSLDGGESFDAVLVPPGGTQEVRAVGYDPTDPRVAFAGTPQGLFRSLDGGGTWEPVEPLGLHNRDIADIASLDWGLLLATANGVFLSADSGASFRELHAGLDDRDVRRLAATAAPLDVRAATARGLFVYRPPAARARKLRALADMRRLIAGEPEVGEVGRRALAAAQLSESSSAQRLRASLAPLAPRLTVNFDSYNPWGDAFQQHVWAGLPPTVQDTLRSSGGFQVLALWDLARFAGGTAQQSVAASHRRLEAQRTRLLRRVVSTYTTRRRLQVSLIESPPADARGRAYKVLQIEELTAVLDSLTGGYFSEAVADANRAGPSPDPSGRQP